MMMTVVRVVTTIGRWGAGPGDGLQVLEAHLGLEVRPEQVLQHRNRIINRVREPRAIADARRRAAVGARVGDAVEVEARDARIDVPLVSERGRRPTVQRGRHLRRRCPQVLREARVRRRAPRRRRRSAHAADRFVVTFRHVGRRPRPRRRVDLRAERALRVGRHGAVLIVRGMACSHDFPVGRLRREGDRLPDGRTSPRGCVSAEARRGLDGGRAARNTACLHRALRLPAVVRLRRPPEPLLLSARAVADGVAGERARSREDHGLERALLLDQGLRALPLLFFSDLRLDLPLRRRALAREARDQVVRLDARQLRRDRRQAELHTRRVALLRRERAGSRRRLLRRLLAETVVEVGRAETHRRLDVLVRRRQRRRRPQHCGGRRAGFVVEVVAVGGVGDGLVGGPCVVVVRR
mmetsp:Transcript_30519/g.94270  ORF Transcript_30519/g.94270 Transcript_30519/m.94270 type:complete len:410 (-) Transcript_30519:631-1860(-)